MKRILGIALIAFSVSACAGSAVTPQPVTEATRYAIATEVVATITASAPTATHTAVPTLTATATGTATPTLALAPTATEAPTLSPTPTVAPSSTPALAATETPLPATATPEATPEATATPLPPTPAPEAASPTAAPPPPAAPVDALTVNFTNLHYECQMKCFTSGARPDDPQFFAYRSFQALMQLRNNTADLTVDWNWREQARWYITDGTNTRTIEGAWEWLAAPGEFYQKPAIAPGAAAKWTFVTLPIERNEWVSAVEFEAWGQVYRQELDLGPFRTDHNYVDGGVPLFTRCGE